MLFGILLLALLRKIKIGLVVPLSGDSKELGESVLNSVKLAINDINDDIKMMNK